MFKVRSICRQIEQGEDEIRCTYIWAGRSESESHRLVGTIRKRPEDGEWPTQRSVLLLVASSGRDYLGKADLKTFFTKVDEDNQDEEQMNILLLRSPVIVSSQERIQSSRIKYDMIITAYY